MFTVCPGVPGHAALSRGGITLACTPYDLKQWRSRLRWTQARAADALCFHLQAYKKLECGTKMIVPRVQLLCELLERQHVRVMH